MGTNENARKRALYTGQAHQHAIKSLHRDQGKGSRPIPVASTAQAALEALILERIGEWNPVFWSPFVLAYGIAWVDPSPEDLTIGIPAQYLPDLIRGLIPTLHPKAASASDDVEIQGIPGLRFSYEGGHVVLYRPGETARVRIPLKNESLWHKALKIGIDDFDSDLTFPWDSHPNAWHPAELYFINASWPGRYAIGGEHYQASRLASDLLRRLPGLCGPFLAHDMWFNFHGATDSEYYIQFEWQNSRPPNAVLDLILDRTFGLDVHIDLVHDQHSLADAYADHCTRVRLVSRDGSGSRIDLRYLRFKGDLAEEVPPLFEGVRSRRRELEHLHDYPLSPPAPTAPRRVDESLNMDGGY
ncbi:hypothetical protein [Microbispora sp. H10836]|uniref:hypothetical protein n=1 Tax=Microbispora sp. H10836 TaxID=2729106 RepID=UPI0014763A71|nr:hypothetical protein [Microbispora sp. H10836]